MSCINTVMFSGGPILVAISAFGTYAWLGNELTADVAFPALAYFDLLRFPIIMLPTQVMNFINASVALKRLQEFVDADEVEQMPESTLYHTTFFRGCSALRQRTTHSERSAWICKFQCMLKGSEPFNIHVLLL